MLDPSSVDLGALAEALADQESYDSYWTVNRTTGAVEFWSRDTDDDIDEHDDAPDLVIVDAVPSRVWYRDMADFANGVADESAARRLGRALEGRGAFRRFKDELHQRHPELLPAWNAFRDGRARQRAIEWLLDNGLVDEAAAERYISDNPVALDVPRAGSAHEDVVRLELELLRPEVRADADRAAALLDPEFAEIGASGRLWNREEILASLARELVDGPPITAEDVTTVEVAEGVVLVRWVSLREGRRARRSSLWRRTDEGWRMLFHQGTLSDL